MGTICWIVNLLVFVVALGFGLSCCVVCLVLFVVFVFFWGCILSKKNSNRSCDSSKQKKKRFMERIR